METYAEVQKSINRNIVECKVYQKSGRGYSRVCINRNIVECKDAELSAQDKADKVLIETSWNVKLRRQKDILVLSTSINRNIVECKVCYGFNYLPRT